jgi:molybdate transport system substrate-binding protein
MQLAILSGGAAQGLVAALAAEFKAVTGCDITGTFGAVGAMRDKLIAGAPADLLILTQALIAELARLGHVLPDSPVDLGVVRTGVAVRSGNPKPPIGSAAALRSALLAADAIYFPDPKLATAGIHFAKVLDALGIVGEVAARLEPFPNGAAAMQALARAPDARAIGCTQVTEILNTPGAVLVGSLPKEFELATVYTAGVCTRAALPGQAKLLATMLSDDAAHVVREKVGFEPIT